MFTDQPHTSGQADAGFPVLQVDASARYAESATRRLTRAVVDTLRTHHAPVRVTHRDLAADPPPPVDEA